MLVFRARFPAWGRMGPGKLWGRGCGPAVPWSLPLLEPSVALGPGRRGRRWLPAHPCRAMTGPPRLCSDR